MEFRACGRGETGDADCRVASLLAMTPLCGVGTDRVVRPYGRAMTGQEINNEGERNENGDRVA